MKTVLLCLSLCICSLVIAKNKVFPTGIHPQGKGLKSIENTIIGDQIGAEFNGPNTTLTPTVIPHSASGMFYYDNSFGHRSEFFHISEFSYNSTSGSAGSIQESKADNPYISHEANQHSQVVFRQGMFYGFALMLVLGNLVCFFLFEENTFLYYSMALASTSLLYFFSDGLISMLGFEPIFATESIFLVIATACISIFVSKFLLLEEHLPKLRLITGLLLFTSTIVLTFAIVTENEVFVNIANTLLYSIMGIYFLTGIYLFGRKNYAKFYVIAAAIPLLFSVDYFLLRPMGIDFLSTQTIHIKAAAIAEMLIITYAIMYRMQAIKEEHALRQAELRIFLKRQEVLTTRQKTEQLVEDVYLENLIMHYDLDGLEIKLLQYISEGKQNAKIARKLKTTEHDIEDLTKELYDKLEIGEQIQQDFRMLDAQPDYIYN